MKLAKRISIALLAACVVGGSAFAMTACGGGSEPEPVDSTPTATDSVSSEEEVKDNDPVSPSAGEVADHVDPEVSTQGTMSFRDAYVGEFLKLDATVPFGEAAFLDLVNSLQPATADETKNIDVRIGEDWELLEFELEQKALDEAQWMMPSESVLAENEIGVGLLGTISWAENDRLVSGPIAVYFGYNEATQNARACKLVMAVYGADDQTGADSMNVYEGEDAQNKLMELLDA